MDQPLEGEDGDVDGRGDFQGKFPVGGDGAPESFVTETFADFGGGDIAGVGDGPGARTRERQADVRWRR